MWYYNDMFRYMFKKLNLLRSRLKKVPSGAAPAQEAPPRAPVQVPPAGRGREPEDHGGDPRHEDRTQA